MTGLLKIGLMEKVSGLTGNRCQEAVNQALPGTQDHLEEDGMYFLRKGKNHIREYVLMGKHELCSIR